MAASTHNIVCPHCGSTNRIPAERDARAGKCGRCAGRLFDGHPVAATAASFDAQVAHSDVPVVVDFWAGWCGPCRAMAPAYEQVAAELEPRFRFLKVDVDAEPALAARFSIRSIPTLMVLQHGAVLAQQPGAMDRNSLRAWLAQSAAR